MISTDCHYALTPCAAPFSEPLPYFRENMHRKHTLVSGNLNIHCTVVCIIKNGVKTSCLSKILGPKSPVVTPAGARLGFLGLKTHPTLGKIFKTAP